MSDISNAALMCIGSAGLSMFLMVLGATIARTARRAIGEIDGDSNATD